MRVIGSEGEATFMAYGDDRGYSIGRTLRHAVIEFHQDGRIRTVRHYTARFTDDPWEAWALSWAQLYAQTLGLANGQRKACSRPGATQEGSSHSVAKWRSGEVAKWRSGEVAKFGGYACGR